MVTFRLKRKENLTMQAILNYVIAHSTLFATLGVAVLDFSFAINDKLKSNGIIHAVYMFLGGKKGTEA